MYIFSTLKGFCVIFQHRTFPHIWYFENFLVKIIRYQFFLECLVLLFQPSSAMSLVLLEHFIV
jgi:hypothetical protein